MYIKLVNRVEIEEKVTLTKELSQVLNSGHQ